MWYLVLSQFHFNRMGFYLLVLNACFVCGYDAEVGYKEALENVEVEELYDDVEPPQCRDWASVGECTTNPRFMLKACAHACSQRSVVGQPPPLLTVSSLPAEETEEAAVAKARRDMSSAFEGIVGTRLGALLEGTYTQACREEVVNALHDHVTRFLGEQHLPFQDVAFASQCPAPDATVSLPVNTSQRQHADGPIRIAYLLLVHDRPEQTMRLIRALTEKEHHFVIHLDTKAPREVRRRLEAFAETAASVHLVPQAQSVSVAWGGFNVVEATLRGISLALGPLGLDFDYLVNLSGYHYPLVSNTAISERLEGLPSREVNLMQVDPTPSTPAEGTWHYYVECDDRLRRIWRLALPRGIHLFTGSQWFMIARSFAHWLVNDLKLVPLYREYGKHTVVADENFFATLLKNSPFCASHENSNSLHVQFDQWEHDKVGHTQQVNKAKCLQPNPHHCGRSPTVNTVEYLPTLLLSGDLFARKFDPEVDSRVLDAIDALRTPTEQAAGDNGRPVVAAGEEALAVGAQGAHFRDVRVLLRLSPLPDTASSSFLCLELNSKRAAPVRLEPCTLPVPLASDPSEEQPQEQSPNLELGPCSPDGTLAVPPHDAATATGNPRFMAVGKGRWTRPFCPLSTQAQQNSTLKLCLDLEGESVLPGTTLISWRCAVKWNQLLSFGMHASTTGNLGAHACSSSSSNAPTSCNNISRSDETMEVEEEVHPGSIFINIPYADHQDTRFCLEAALEIGVKGPNWELQRQARIRESGQQQPLFGAGKYDGGAFQRGLGTLEELRGGAFVVVAPCDPKEPRQRFEFADMSRGY
mmetsp:Transcript_75543/g.147952  ORF Transcript_75543/g.147952 Transcript_75543/m.147952 type:complete len:811 (-) Transcript_75543:130-2562(-)